jgi:hypothetical protein
MPTYLYCLTSTAAEPPSAELRGIDGAPVRTVEVEDVRVWVSTLEVAPRPTAEHAAAHDGVVRQALRGATPLPVRFGQLLPDDDAVRRDVGALLRAARAGLRRVEGMVEMTVRLSLPAPKQRKSIDVKGLSGREYLLRVRAEQEAEMQGREGAEFLQRQVAGAVADVARAESVSTVRDGSGAGETLVISHLIPRDAVVAYRKALEGMADSESPLRVTISGPWAPYSFADLSRE